MCSTATSSTKPQEAGDPLVLRVVTVNATTDTATELTRAFDKVLASVS